MKELLETFTVEQIIIFLALLGFSIKEVVSFFDWASARINQKVKKENVHDELKNEIIEFFSLKELDLYVWERNRDKFINKTNQQCKVGNL